MHTNEKERILCLYAGDMIFHGESQGTYKKCPKLIKKFSATTGYKVTSHTQKWIFLYIKINKLETKI